MLCKRTVLDQSNIAIAAAADNREQFVCSSPSRRRNQKCAASIHTPYYYWRGRNVEL